MSSLKALVNYSEKNLPLGTHLKMESLVSEVEVSYDELPKQDYDYLCSHALTCKFESWDRGSGKVIKPEFAFSVSEKVVLEEIIL